MYGDASPIRSSSLLRPSALLEDLPSNWLEVRPFLGCRTSPVVMRRGRKVGEMFIQNDHARFDGKPRDRRDLRGLRAASAWCLSSQSRIRVASSTSSLSASMHYPKKSRRSRLG